MTGPPITPRHAYFIGCGGIGMSALAQLFSARGVRVSGSDRERSRVTDLLESKGMTVLTPQRAENVPADADVVIYSDAVPPENPERERAHALRIPQYSYFEMLGSVSRGTRTIAVAGTHGKTTTTGMLGKILVDAGESPTVIVGSLTKDFGSNYVRGDSDLFIVEACEYRNHLLELSPEALVVNNLEWDHTDFFPSLREMQKTFQTAIERVPERGAIVTNPADPAIAPLLAGARARIIDYTREPAYELLLPGDFNVENARAAAAAARFVRPDLSEEVIARSLAGFHGTWRRFEFKGETEKGALVYDDYAHHPTAVEKTLQALRARTKGRVIVAFHPHLFSRTRDLFEGFANAFHEADEVFLAPIYGAREKDDGTISSARLAKRMRALGVHARALDSFDAVERALSAARAGDAIMTMGAGDIYKVADRLVRAVPAVLPAVKKATPEGSRES